MMTKPLALVTGGNAGIGFEISQILAVNGYNLVIAGIGDVETAKKELEKLGSRVTAVRCNLITAEGNQELIDAVKETAEPLNLLVLNAGISVGGAFIDHSLEEHLNVISLDLLSPVRLTYGFLPDMIKAGGGKILFISSLSATTPTPYESVYGPSKAFISSFANSIHEELRDKNIQITTAHPGATATNFHAKAGMQTTAFGDNSWKNSPLDIAKQAYDALVQGKTNVACGDEDTQKAWITNHQLSDEEKAKIHAERAIPNSKLKRGM